MMIDSWFQEYEIEYLKDLAADVQDRGHIVDIGTWIGTSAFAMADACLSTVTVHTFDDYKYAIRDRSAEDAREQFDYKIRKNVTFHHKHSPPLHWLIPVDLVFIDAKRSLWHNLDFWYNKLKPDGILCGHDFNKENPDVQCIVSKWIEKNGKKLQKTCGCIWRVYEKKI
jgi:predicted O-methyltransferase YrrM